MKQRPLTWEERVHCRICGYQDADDPPYFEDGSGTFAFCPCCGVEWGYQDYAVERAREFRTAWLKQGAPWSEPKARPSEWTLEEQMAHVPEDYR